MDGPTFGPDGAPAELGDRLVTALMTPRAVEVGLTTGLQGAGGFGKTRPATWVCHRPEIDRRYPGGLHG